MNQFTPSDEQRRIIEHPPESLRVAAGAGTGKTATIVRRIAHLVEAGVDPSRILGVTFTNKAADELNLRVLDAIGGQETDRIPEISTYHGFASTILDEFGAYVGYDASARLMDDGHRTELASRVLRTTPSSNLDLTSLSTRRREMLTLSAALTDNLTAPDDVRAAAPPGVSSADAANADEPALVWLKRLALLDAVGMFEAEKQRLSLLEYGDLIRLAVDVVEGSSEVASEIGARYEAVVLDEYQDTDPAQRRLLRTLFSTRVPVLAVGDTDQTIYEWRGASAENFTAFPVDFPSSDGTRSLTLPLSRNRRSDTLILDLANRIREELPQVEGALPLTPGEEADTGAITTSWFDTDASEAAWIASEVQRLHHSGGSWGDSAVLCRKRSLFEPVVSAFDKLEIPYSVGSMGQLLEVPEIADLLAWLSIIDDPADEVSFVRVLLGGRFRLGMSALAHLRRWCRDNDGATLFDAALASDKVGEMDDRSRARITDFLSLHQRLVHFSQLATIPSIVEAIIDNLGYWDEVAALDPGPSLTARINLGRFSDLAQQWRPIEGGPTLGGFLRYLAALDESGRADELAAATPLQLDAVSILTVHAAKGLEWDNVFLPGIADQVFPSRSHAHDNPDRIAQMLPYELRLNSEIHAAAASASGTARQAILKERHLDQEWRLAYVAVTRAAKHLSISGHAWDVGISNARQPSPLWLMASELPGATVGPMEPVADTPHDDGPYAEPEPIPDPLFPSGFSAALRRSIADPSWIGTQYPDVANAVADRVSQLELAIDDLAEPHLEPEQTRFAVSVTNLVTLASCPQKFKWIHHDRLPRQPRRSAVLGTAFHRRIELHHLGVIAFDDPEQAGTDRIGDAQDGDIDRSDPWELFESSRFSADTPLHVESAFEIGIGEGSIRGKIDAIYEPVPGTWEIVDYKSGRFRDDPARKVQLEAYAIAAAEGAISSEPPDEAIVTFAYFGGGTLEEVSEVVDAEWLDGARARVEELVSLGISGPYEPSPSADCRWCDFLHLCPAGQNFLADDQAT